MRTSVRKLLFFTIALVACLFAPRDADAYIGPGVGITAIGTVIALLGAIIFAIVGFVWYPIKRVLAMFRKSVRQSEAHKASVS